MVAGEPVIKRLPRMVIAEGTVKNHLSNIFDKLEAATACKLF
jgi:DNA-binding NarL/FixJ family response regulator